MTTPVPGGQADNPAVALYAGSTLTMEQVA